MAAVETDRSEAKTTEAPKNSLTIEQVADRTGMTVRNIRSHRARGLLQAPEVRNRIGYYGPSHLERLALIRDLQAEGLNLEGIKALVARSGEKSPKLIELKQALSAPLESEEPQVFTVKELAERFGGVEPDLLKQAEKVGMLVPIGTDRYEAPAPSLLDTAEELIQMGVPLEHGIAVARKVEQRCREVAKEFVRLFIDDLVRPAEEEGISEERFDETRAAIDQLLPISSNVVLSIYRLTMAREVEAAYGKELRRLTSRSRKSSKSKRAR